jgi:hypothetical protein
MFTKHQLSEDDISMETVSIANQSIIIRNDKTNRDHIWHLFAAMDMAVALLWLSLISSQISPALFKLTDIMKGIDFRVSAIPVSVA